MELAEKYNKQFAEVQKLIHEAKCKANTTVNTLLIELYWRIGAYVHRKIANSEWGKSIVRELAEFIRENEPDSKGFSAQNIWRMKQFYEAYYQSDLLSPVVRELSWTNNLIILSKTSTEEDRGILSESSRL